MLLAALGRYPMVSSRARRGMRARIAGMAGTILAHEVGSGQPAAT
jgi:hypothetical protein